MDTRQIKARVAEVVKEAVGDRVDKIHGWEMQDAGPLEMVIRVVLAVGPTLYYRVKISEVQ